MRISEQVLLCVLRQGGCVRSFWHCSARLAGMPAPVVPKSLDCAETWTQTVGGTEFGGAVWRLAPDTDAQVQGNGEPNEQ